MKNPYDESPRVSVAAMATLTILALIVAMTITIVFDIQPVEAAEHAGTAHTSMPVA